MTKDDLDPVFKALSDPTRRAILDILRDGPRTTTEIVNAFPDLTRFAVMKHMEVLRSANLMITRSEGRRRINAINAVPIRQIYEKWVSPFADLWASHLVDIKHAVEGDRVENN